MNYSKQRESIRRALYGRTDHPTAETIYNELKAEFPKMSLGTVYRNLTLLAQQHEIRKISTGVGPDRFDPCVEPHAHVQCVHCGCVDDLYLQVEEGLIAQAAEAYAGTINKATVLFAGTCPRCSHLHFN